MPAPPSTFGFTLVIIKAPSDARNKNALAMSSGIWRRPSGVASSLRWQLSGLSIVGGQSLGLWALSWRMKGVSTWPGETMLRRMPSDA